MATRQQSFTSTCLICFETKPLKIVGNCKHSFCIKCLSTIFGSLETGSVVFACPSCKVDCPRPHDGVLGLVDFTGGTDNVTVTDAESVTAKETDETADETAIDVICDLCHHKQREVKAANVCVECDNLHICQDCSKKHRLNKFTSSHMLTPIATKQNKKELVCEPHDKWLNCFCKTCEKPVCMICVSLDHENHNVERLADVIRSKVSDVKVTLGMKEKKLKELQHLEMELMQLKSMAPTVDKQDTLINGIEDHAQKLIDQIVKWKEDLKKEVKMDFQVIRDIPVALANVSGTVHNLLETVNRANQVLADSEHHPPYLDKLVALQQELADIAETQDGGEGKELLERLVDLHRNVRNFVPADKQHSHGKIDKYVQRWKLNIYLFEHTMKADSADMFIPCVAVLSPTYFAVAHPVKPGGLSHAIDIYEFTGTLKMTLTDHVPPVYDMTSTPSGLLAVLSDGTQGGRCCVKVFDPETGYISSTQDIKMSKPLSLGVTIRHQYVILGVNGQGRSQITVVDEDGVEELQYVIDEASDDIVTPRRITCGWRFIFVSGERNIAIYEITNTETPRIMKCSTKYSSVVTNISATKLDDILTAWTNSSYVSLSIDQNTTNRLYWLCIGSYRVHKKPKRDLEVRVSTRDGRIAVISHGRTIKVVKCS